MARIFKQLAYGQSGKMQSCANLLFAEEGRCMSGAAKKVVYCQFCAMQMRREVNEI